jgi:hypothetical protein
MANSRNPKAEDIHVAEAGHRAFAFTQQETVTIIWHTFLLPLAGGSLSMLLCHVYNVNGEMPVKRSWQVAMAMVAYSCYMKMATLFFSRGWSAAAAWRWRSLYSAGLLRVCLFSYSYYHIPIRLFSFQKLDKICNNQPCYLVLFCLCNFSLCAAIIFSSVALNLNVPMSLYIRLCVFYSFPSPHPSLA